MKILAVETSASAASCAVYDDGKLLAEFFTDVKLTHSQTVMPMTEALLKCAKIELSDIDLFAVAYGPGSFTGLRIGIAAVKGLAYAQNKPCIGISTLEAMAYTMQSCQGCICCVMDARCSQVYTATFKCTDGKIERIYDDEAIKIDELKEKLIALNSTIFLIGDGAQLCYNKFVNEIPSVRLAPFNVRSQHASGICAAAALKPQDEWLTADKLIPSYLRLPQAQRELMAKKALEKKA